MIYQKVSCFVSAVRLCSFHLGALGLSMGALFISSDNCAAYVGAEEEASGAKIGSITIRRPSTVSHSMPKGVGSFGAIFAEADDSAVGGTDFNIPPIPGSGAYHYLSGTTYDTTLARQTGVKFDPQAQAIANVTAVSSSGTVTWNNTGSLYGIPVLGPTGTTTETATAKYGISDPIYFELTDADIIEVDFLFGAGITRTIDPGLLSLNEDFSALIEIDFTAESDIPGLEDLMSLQIDLDHLGSASVDFSCNPSLCSASEVSQITQDILDSIQFDPLESEFTFTSEIAIGVETPPLFGLTSARIDTALSESAFASIELIPEPSSVLLVLSALGLIACRSNR